MNPHEPILPPRCASSVPTPLLLSAGGASWKSHRRRGLPGSNHLGRSSCGPKMKAPLTRCSECIVYHNWHQMGEWKKSFIKIVTGDFMDVPRRLANTIRSQVSDEVKIEVPNGKSFSVQVSKEDNGLVFKSGWAAFASAYELEQGDILLFESSGSSCFEVRIFNQSGCEKELSCVAMNNTPSVHERNICHESEMQSPGNERYGSMRSKYHAVCKGCTASHYWHHMDKIRFFLVMMDVGDLKDGLTIPKQFGDNIRGQISQEINLEVPDGQTYSVQVNKEQHKLVLGSGWDAFTRAYELEEGDMLLFGYDGKSHLKVRIFNGNGCDKLFACVMKNITPCGQSPTERTGPNDQMNKPCRICRECVAHHYWHMKDHEWCFFRVMSLSNFKDEMAIPKEFTTNFRGHISDKVRLEVADGKIYSVQVAKEQDMLVLRSGWGKFAGAYDLELYDFLLFTYSGNSHFKVRIMKQNCCEKELSCVVMNSDPNVQERDNVHEQPLPIKRRCQYDISSPSRKTLKMTPGDSSSQKLRSELKRYVVTKRTKLTYKQKRKIKERLQAINPDITIFVSLVHRNRSHLYIKLRYAYDHLPSKEQTVKLQRPEVNCTWKTKLQITNGGKMYELVQGWTKFTKDNNLQQGDMCLFELLKNEKELTMNVHIIRGD